MIGPRFFPSGDGFDHIFQAGSMLPTHQTFLRGRPGPLHDLADGHCVPGHDLVRRLRIRWCGHDWAPYASSSILKNKPRRRYLHVLKTATKRSAKANRSESHDIFEDDDIVQ